MAPSKKSIPDAAAGEIMFNETFKLVQQLNAMAGPTMVKKGVKSGNISFSPKIIVDNAGDRQYTCSVDIYTPKTMEAGPEIGMELSGTDMEQFKQALAIASIALSGLARQTYLSETYTVGLVKPESEEIEIYTPKVLEPGMYSIKEED